MAAKGLPALTGFWGAGFGETKLILPVHDNGLTLGCKMKDGNLKVLNVSEIS